jgi:hypothetical protein
MKRLLIFFLLAGSVGAQALGTQSGSITLGTSSTMDNAYELQIPTTGPPYGMDCLRPGKEIAGVKKLEWYACPTGEPPKPEWVPDPSAGHYDCPDGWTAYTKSEPEVWSYGGATFAAYPITANGVFIPPPRDKKGHVLGVQPPAPICVVEPTAGQGR